MVRNVGGADQIVRAVAGIALALAAILVPMDTIWRVALLALAGVAIFTAAIRYCPLNSLIGLNTCRTPRT